MPQPPVPNNVSAMPKVSSKAPSAQQSLAQRARMQPLDSTTSPLPCSQPGPSINLRGITWRGKILPELVRSLSGAAQHHATLALKGGLRVRLTEILTAAAVIGELTLSQVLY